MTWSEVIDGRVVEHDGDPPATQTLADFVPEIISDRQFGAGLWNDGIITYDQCVAFVSTGTIPPPLQAIIDMLPDDDTGEPTPRKMATVLVKGAKDYHFSDPLVEIVREAMQAQDPKWTRDYLGDRWRIWATL